MFTIRMFALRKTVNSAQELVDTLSSDYKGEMVSIQYQNSRGMKRVLFASITMQGEINPTYGNDNFDFEAIEEELCNHA